MNRWSSRAIKSFSMAELEARKLKYPQTGTEAFLMGMLTEGIFFCFSCNTDAFENALILLLNGYMKCITERQ